MPVKKKIATPQQTALGMELIVEAVPPTTIVSPDITELVLRYNKDIRPLANFKLTSNAEYKKAGEYWNDAAAWIDEVEHELGPATDLAFKVHRTLTGMRGVLTAPALALKDYMGRLRLEWEEKDRRERAAAAARLQAEQDAKHAEEARIAAEAHKQSQIEADLENPWGDDDPDWDEPTKEVAVFQPPPPPPPVVIPSSIPSVVGAPQSRDLPYQAQLDDFSALIIECAKRLPNGDASLVPFLAFDQVAANRKARELGEDIKNVVPGVSAVRPKTLART